MRVSLVKEVFWRIGGLKFSAENVPGQDGTACWYLKFPRRLLWTVRLSYEVVEG
jgi:hypothetical protein